MPNYVPGTGVEIRAELWIVRRVERSIDEGLALLCNDISELVRDRSAWSLMELEGEVRLSDPTLTELVPDKSPQSNLKKEMKKWMNDGLQSMTYANISM